jgi:hypothetical protein
MGMLDDAIREHLELKRRSGASDDEVRQLETEAFGAKRAVAQPEPEAEPDVEAAEAAPLAAEPELDPAPTPVEPPPASAPAAEPWLAEEDAVAPDEEEGEDLLEETPDFLSETPEHDRLWFEQRPPRDFDFDE